MVCYEILHLENPMAEKERNEDNRRFGSGTRSDKDRRDTPDEDWALWEKRQSDERRQDDRRNDADRRDDES
jgi:hypothetical protein